jgi:glycogen phosphorylase
MLLWQTPTNYIFLYEVRMSNDSNQKQIEIRVEDDRTGVEEVTLKRAFLDHLYYSQAKDQHTATPHDKYVSLALTVRDRLIQRWMKTQQEYYKQDAKRIYYLSAEFLMGRALESNLLNVGLLDTFKKILSELNIDLTELINEEPDAGLGNGGLGRLAACFVDSMATLGYAGYGYGIRYEFGIFDQEIRDGQQVEHPDEWLKFGSTWEISRPEYMIPVNFYGRCEESNEDGQLKVRWVETKKVMGMPYDTPVAGFGTTTVNNLRLWRARASHDFDLSVFNEGDYERAVEEKNMSENISKVLYPKDDTTAGKELRLKQQYFFVACSITDIVRRYLKTHKNFAQFSNKVAIQLNDTHPTIAIPELMRLLIDVYNVSWEDAWEITQKTFAYTNHTLLSEALEKWSVALFEELLPRHLQIIYEINRRFLRQVRAKYPYDEARMVRMSLIEEGKEKMVRMANLAVAGSHSVNGVAALHSELVKHELLRDFYELFPERFNNKTNGVTPRRWLLQCNPRLANLITETIGASWITKLSELKKLQPLAANAGFRQKIRDIKRKNKEELAAYILKNNKVQVDLNSIFDVQIKRIHEYKRQHLNILHTIHRYLQIKQNPNGDFVPRTVIFGGKAAPGYYMAKLIIRLVNDVAAMVNNDPDVRGRLKVVFLANYRVSLAEKIFPASDLSQQISTAGKEASGTGNMKFSMNGALTIGTLDGANVEIREEVGPDNFFLFGLTASEVTEQKRKGYNPWDSYHANADLKAVVDLVNSGFFCPEKPDTYRPLLENLLRQDPYMLFADFASYVECQNSVDNAYRNQERWSEMAVINIASTGKFSSDRTIEEYANEIWHATPIKVSMDPAE